MNIGILILAGGSASRMGQAKQLLPIGETTLLGVAIQHAKQSKAIKVFCVLGAHASKISAAVGHTAQVIINENWKLGLSSSIASGISYINNTTNLDALVIMLGDQPLVTSSYINALIDNFTETKSIVASSYDLIFGVPAIFPKSVFGELMQLEGDTGAKLFLNDPKNKVKALTSQDTLLDIDTPEDYKAFIKKYC